MSSPARSTRPARREPGTDAGAEEFDAVIIGARCAGAATAIALASRGLQVLVVDSGRFPSDTLSTHLLWPSTVAEIHALGALAEVEATGAPRMPVAEGVLDDIGWQATYSAVAGIDYAMCVRRTRLDEAVLRAATAAGAVVRQRCKATGLIWRDGRVSGIDYTDADEQPHRATAPIVIGADGRKSLVAREVGAETLLSAPSGRACYFAYWTDPREDLRHVASQWRVDDLLGTAFPCDDGHMLCLLQPPVRLTENFRGRRVTEAYLQGIADLPGLQRRVDGAEMVSRVRSCTGIESYFRRSAGPGWALPGDAGHFKDPVTAQGIRDAYRYGRLLGERLAPILGARGGADLGAVDVATACWAAQRERECIEMYQWTNFLAAGLPPSPLEYELYRRAARRTDYAGVLLDIYNRVQRPSAMLPPTALPSLFAGALRAPDTGIRDVLTDLREQQGRMRAEWRERRSLGRPPKTPGADADADADADAADETSPGQRVAV